MKRIIFFIVAALILGPVAIVGYQTFYNPGSNEVASTATNISEQIVRGAYLTRAGDCFACHTLHGGKPLAGGREIATPYGSIFTPNITPDPTTGIGAWNANDFWRAMHNGKSRNGQFLYPAFPFTDYTKVTRTDSDAIFAYLKTLQPVHQANRENELRFPYNQRVLLAVWRSLYFHPETYAEDKGKSAEWNRGAYLVQGLGHCNSCHTGRAAFGSTDVRSDMEGGLIPSLNWYAPSLTSDMDAGLGNWGEHDIVELLKRGISNKGAVFGPMAEVVADSTQFLSHNDANSIANYLKSLHQTDDQSISPSDISLRDTVDVLMQGAKIYTKHCASCHQSKGQGVAAIYPPLAGNQALTMQSAANAIRMVVNGGFPPSTLENPRPYGMPPFGPVLDDKEIAAVVSYIRNSWGNRAEIVTPTRSTSPRRHAAGLGRVI